jgi:enoyl-CoA hydratase
MIEREDISGDTLLFERRGPLVLVTLNRPDALNALSHEMALALEKRLLRYERDPDVAAIVVQGAGERAFCAGGDVRRLYDDGLSGGPYPYRFYPDEYRLNAYIFHYSKPYIALIDGIDMGGGVGVSVHGSHRVVTERLNFAMPETGIGLFPDVGGSYFLPRLPGEIGIYMAMTGARLSAADAVYAGVGDAYVPSDRLDDLIAALEKAPYRHGAQTAASRAMMDFAAEPGESNLAALQDRIDDIFGRETVEEMLAALDEAGDEWAVKTAKTMRSKSPTSMKIALRQIRTGATLDFHDCMRMENRIAYGCIHGHDFYEGVRAVIIDKDQSPKWQPATLEEVGEADIDPYFNDVPPNGDLEFDPPVYEDDGEDA